MVGILNTDYLSNRHLEAAYSDNVSLSTNQTDSSLNLEIALRSTETEQQSSLPKFDKRVTLEDKNWLLSSPPPFFWRVHISPLHQNSATTKKAGDEGGERNAEMDCTWDPHTTFSPTAGFIAKDHSNYRLTQLLSKANIRSHLEIYADLSLPTYDLYSGNIIASRKQAGPSISTGLISIFDSCEDAMEPLPALYPDQTGISIVQICTSTLKPGIVRLWVKKGKTSRLVEEVMQKQINRRRQMESQEYQKLQLKSYGMTTSSTVRCHTQREMQQQHHHHPRITPCQKSKNSSPSSKWDTNSHSEYELVKLRVYKSKDNGSTDPVTVISAAELFSIYEYDFPHYFNKGEYFALEGIPASMFENVYTY